MASTFIPAHAHLYPPKTFVTTDHTLQPFLRDEEGRSITGAAVTHRHRRGCCSWTQLVLDSVGSIERQDSAKSRGSVEPPFSLAR